MTTRTKTAAGVTHQRALSALRLLGPLTVQQLAKELRHSANHTSQVLRDLVHAGEITWAAGTVARIRTKPAAASNAPLAPPAGYSVRDGLGNEVAWFADHDTAVAVWERVPCAVQLVEAATRRVIGGEG
jgi:hypothetical protein